MKQIVLTRGKYTLVDDEDYEYLSQWKWHADKGTKTFYARRNSLSANGKRHIIKMHHEIIGKPPKGFEVDHRNGNGLWNLKNNLRFVTHRQNGQNRKNEKSSSKFPGVCWDKNRQKWMARIETKGITQYLGRFINEFEAFEVYRQAIESIGEKVIEDF